MSEHRLVVLLRESHKRIWAAMTPDQKRLAVAACNGLADQKTLDRVIRVARRTK